MKYNNIIKTNPEFNVIGYALMNQSKKTMILAPDGGLIIRSKVKDFDYYKGFVPFEVSAEQVILGMFQFEAIYTFDFESLNSYLDIIETNDIEFYNQEMYKEWRKWKPDSKNELISISISTGDSTDDNSFDPQLN